MAGRDLRFLLHLWRDERGSLRASLRNVADGELRLFTGLEDLQTFLKASTDVAGGAQIAHDDGPARGG